MLEFYFEIYAITVLAYLWYRFIFRFIYELKKKTNTFFLEKYPYSVVVPVYNEKPELLTKCIRSLVESEGEKEIILVNDGSQKKELLQTIDELQKKYGIKVLHQQNKGKRYAQKLGIEAAKYPFIVTVDSDSVVFPYSILRLLQPFKDKKVGAVTGRAEALNRNENLLTRMIDARYKNAFGFERASLSALGVITCCSGVLSAYRKEVILPIMDKYVHQKFLGAECTYGDDRHLTNLVLMNDYKIKYVDEALVLTEVPNNYRQFFKQQCLPPTEKLIVRKNGKIQIIKIGDFGVKYGWNRIKGYQTLSFNPETLKIEWKDITGVLKEKKNGRLKEITFNNGRKIVTTCDHEFFLPTYDGFFKKKAGNLKVGDFIPFVNRYKTDQKFIHSLSSSKLNFTKIKSIKEKRYIGDVYDIEVKDNHNFLSYSGIFTSNCRWKKSFIRESLVCLSFCWKKSFWLTLEVLWNLLLPYFSIGARIFAIFWLIVDPSNFFKFFISIVIIAVLRNLLLFIEDRKSAIYSIPYAFLHEFGLYWLFFYAPFKLKETAWGTR